jgi:cytoskeleton protein RodZ
MANGGSAEKQPPASLETAETLGEALRAARLSSGRSLSELSTATRVHTRYLTALEQGDFSLLPSRVFAIGYVRAYASALGLDDLTAVERFKRESPDPSVPLQPPVGIAFQNMRKESPKLLLGLAILVTAVVGWNILQRVNRIEPPHPSDLAAVPEDWMAQADRIPQTPVVLGAPRAAPPDQTTPGIYITPGLEAQLLGAEATDPDAVAAPAPPVQAAFNPRGALYGAAPTASQVVLQARKPASLVVRMGDGRVLFARQLAAGDAWRAPANVVATIDASEPGAFDIYLNGEHGGVLSSPLTPLAGLNARAQTMARQSEARAAALAEAQARARAAAALQAQAATQPQPPTAAAASRPAGTTAPPQTP